MSNDERVRIALEVATKAAEKALESFDAKTKESNATFTVFSGNLLSTFASRAIDSFTSSLSAGFSRAIQEARNTEREINSLNTALAANGLYSEEVSKQFQAFGDSIQATTMYAAGAVHENVALLASMTSLNNEGLQRTMSAATELAATFNLDLNTASQMLGNAFNGNVKSLAKLGLEIDKTKSTAENFDAILVQLEARQGTAASKTNTFEGSQKKLTDSTNSVFVALGNLLTQNPAVISALSKMAEVLATAANHLTSFAEYANANSGIFEILAAGAVTTGVAIAAVGTKALLASTALAGLTTAATAAWTAITGPVGLAVAGIGALGAALYAAYKHWDLIRAGAYSALAATLEFAARGAEAIGSGGMAAALRDQAAEYKKLSSAARAEYDEQSKAAADHTQKYINSSRQRSAAIDEETQKRQQALNDWAQKLAQSVEDESAQNKLRLEDLSLWYDEQAALEGESETINFEARLERERIFFDERKAIQDEMYQAELARVEQSDLTEEERLKARIALEQQYLLQSGKNNVDYSNRQMSIRKAQEAFEAEQNRKKLNSTALLFGALRELTVNGSREAFQISKSFGIAEATIKGYQAVQNAYATGGPFPFNIAAGLAMGIQTALQIRNIVSQQPPAFKEGGIVPGTSYVGDRVTARVNSGEMILNTRQQANLFSLANGSGSSNNETNALLIQLIETVRSSTSISIDGREIFSVMRDGFSDGRRLA